ncbi:MAG: NifB/NifX family molybdenum-iron cluster-binding protein [Desulfovibrionaceae bacterium]|nr:NifB/NifX family molybdenum-iron cluster-binding protein [Desulfovibrionaceae bacterium]
MSQTILAIPSNLPGGLDAEKSGHFGHCEIYTLATIENGAVLSVQTLEAVPHTEGGCLVAVQHLASHGVTALAAGGMGMRPLMGFQELGIAVYRSSEEVTVREVVDAFCKGTLPLFSTDNACKGHH